MGCSVTHWVEDEFKEIYFGDKRLTERFKQVMIGLIKKTTATIASTFHCWADIKSCYRFFENEKVDQTLIFNQHRHKTLERIKQEGKILLLHDTTYIAYKNRPKTAGLDIIVRTPKTKQPVYGLILHHSLALSTAGVPLGLLHQTYVDRKICKGSRACPGSEKKKPISVKESARWIEAIKESHQLVAPSTQVIHVADREGDIYEFYREAAQLEELFIVRVKANRNINKVKRREPPKENLFGHLENKKAQGKIDVPVQVNDGHKYRTANLSVIFSAVTIPPPPNRTINKDGVLLPNIKLNGIMAIERNPPKNKEPIKWVLLTNLPINAIEDALECIHRYSQRWNIELLHKILKSGCSIEKAQLRNAKKLKKYATIKSIVAWRIFWLTRTLAHDANEKCNTILSEDEWKILYLKFNKNKLSYYVPSVREVYYWIARLGGYINRRTDPPPGIISIWKGWQRFMELIEDYYAFCG